MLLHCPPSSLNLFFARIIQWGDLLPFSACIKLYVHVCSVCPCMLCMYMCIIHIYLAICAAAYLFSPGNIFHGATTFNILVVLSHFVECIHDICLVSLWCSMFDLCYTEVQVQTFALLWSFLRSSGGDRSPMGMHVQVQQVGFPLSLLVSCGNLGRDSG